MTHPTIFISYSSKDKKEKEKLQAHLQVLQEANLAQVWSDDNISAGANWEQETNAAIESASVAVLLVTANFINSNSVKNKIIPKLLEQRRHRDLIILPIIAKACAWDTIDWLSQMTVRPKDKPPIWSDGGRHVDEDLADIVREIATAIKNIPISIMGLLRAGLDTGSVVSHVQQLYKTAEELWQSYPQTAADHCQNALNALERGPFGDTSNLNTLPYSRGKFHLLLGSIYLEDESRNLKQAETHFYESRKQFGARKWLHLEALAYLGQAIALRKTNLLDEASDIIGKAKARARPAGMPDDVDKIALSALIAAIKNEEAKISDLIINRQNSENKKSDAAAPEETKTAETPEDDSSVDDEQPTEHPVPIFEIMIGEGLVTAGDVIAPNLLSLEDFQNHTIAPPDQIVIDLIERSTAQYIDYILQVSDQTPVSDDLEPGVWLPIQTVTDPKDLRDRTVAVLVKEDGSNTVSLKKFFEADDHYLLRAKSGKMASMVLFSYKSDLSKIRDYYAIDEKRIVGKRIDEVQIIGAVHRDYRFSEDVLKKMAKHFIWQVPVVNSIAAGLKWPVSSSDINSYVPFNSHEPKTGNYFGFRVVGDSMQEAGISSGQIALIHQQERVDNGDIAAVVIATRETKKPLGTLKQCYLDDRPGKGHWFLKSRHSSAQHIVVIGEGTDPQEVRKMYAKYPQPARFKFYEQAELAIAGKFVTIIPEPSEQP